MNKKIYISYVVYLAALLISRIKSENPEKQENDNSSLYRLPKDVLPINYTILLLTNVSRGDFNYTGTVGIALVVKNQTQQIILHADRLSIDEEKSIVKRQLSDGNYETLQIDSQLYNNETQFQTITFKNYLTPGNYTLVLHFKGEVIDDLLGFYRSSYWVGDERRWIGVTQFSPTFARQAFPCMDEPGLKARFQLSLGHYENETVTSNTDIETRVATDQPGYYITKFKETQRMPTYLLAWAIHDFKRVESPINTGFSLWTRHDNLSFISKSPVLTEGPIIMDTLEKLTGISNPLDKVDQFAVPDFTFSAMENWGFITYREAVAIIGTETVPTQTVLGKLLTIAHEYAHTWFGNLVTPKFWNVVWLKEGFAEYYSYMAMSVIHKDWHMIDKFTVLIQQPSMVDDSKRHARTMNGRNVGSSKSALAALDFVSYKKAASIIRMISSIVGVETFLEAMHSYLNEKQYEASTQYDVYRHLTNALDKKSDELSNPLPADIGTIIDSWANQSNYPLVRASQTGPGQFRFSQEVFRLNRSSITSKHSRSWYIPIRILICSIDGRLGESQLWISKKNAHVSSSIEVRNTTNWYIVNSKQIGYYRVDYELDNWKALMAVLNSTDFRRVPSISRAGLVDDVFNLARAGFEDYALALKLAEYLRQEDEYEPWEPASRAIRLLDAKLRSRPEVHTIFKRYATRLIMPIYKQVTFEEGLSDSISETMLRNVIVATACSFDIEDCVLKAKSIFDMWINDETKSVAADLKNVVYRAGISNGTDDDWTKLWQRFLRAEYASEKEIMMNALAYAKNNSSIIKLIEFTIRPDSNIAKQYRLQLLRLIIAARRENIDIVLGYVEDNLKNIIDLIGFEPLQKILSAVGKEITISEQINKLQQFLDKNANMLEVAAEAGKKAITSAKNNIVWIDKSSTQILKYLQASSTL